MEKLVDSLLESLNAIEVKGKNNLELLLGSIAILEKLKNVIEESASNGSNSEGENTSGEVGSPGQNG